MRTPLCPGQKGPLPGRPKKVDSLLVQAGALVAPVCRCCDAGGRCATADESYCAQGKWRKSEVFCGCVLDSTSWIMPDDQSETSASSLIRRFAGIGECVSVVARAEKADSRRELIHNRKKPSKISDLREWRSAYASPTARSRRDIRMRAEHGAGKRPSRRTSGRGERPKRRRS